MGGETTPKMEVYFKENDITKTSTMTRYVSQFRAFAIYLIALREFQFTFFLFSHFLSFLLRMLLPPKIFIFNVFPRSNSFLFSLTLQHNLFSRLPFTDLCCSVKIQKITVPSVVVMDYNPNNVGRPNLSAPDFLLDCDYDVGENETKIVVKWFLNQQLIYQWIPPRYPTELSHMKNRIKKNFTVSNDPLKMFRALSVTRPSLNLTGEYTCSVQTFESSDKKSSFLQIIGECEVNLNFIFMSSAQCGIKYENNVDSIYTLSHAIFR